MNSSLAGLAEIYLMKLIKCIHTFGQNSAIVYKNNIWSVTAQLFPANVEEDFGFTSAQYVKDFLHHNCDNLRVLMVLNKKTWHIKLEQTKIQ